MFEFINRLIHKDSRNERGDSSIKLDGSELARLINMRVEHAQECSCERCEDLISKIHAEEPLANRQHRSESRGLKFWTLLPESAYAPHPYGSDLVRQTSDNLDQHTLLVDTLIEAEQAWKRSENAECASSDTDDFWSKHYKSVRAICDKLQDRLVSCEPGEFAILNG